MTSGLSVNNYKSHMGRNPNTKKKIGVKPKSMAFFKAGKELKERVDL
jgi:nucleoid DNA-binding protein